MIDVITCRFEDIILLTNVEMGEEHSALFVDEVGGFARILGKGWDLGNDLTLHEIIKKRSIIFRNGERKTTITENVQKPLIYDHILKCESDTVLVSYAEDFEWVDKPGCMPVKGNKTIFVDFSGRFEDVSTIGGLVLDAMGHGFCVVPILTDHDVVDEHFLSELSSKCGTVMFHTPTVIKLFMYGEEYLTVNNDFYIESGLDYVGFGDYLALRIIRELKESNKVRFEKIRQIQRDIRGLIDEY